VRKTRDSGFALAKTLRAVIKTLKGPSLNGDVKAHPSAAVTVDSPPEVKVSLFKDLFRNRDDVYAVRWEGRNGKTGYSPAGDKEWDKAPSLGRGPKKSFRLTKLFSLTEEVIRDHLLGKQPSESILSLQDDTCWFVAVDFDKKSWASEVGDQRYGQIHRWAYKGAQYYNPALIEQSD